MENLIPLTQLNCNHSKYTECRLHCIGCRGYVYRTYCGSFQSLPMIASELMAGLDTSLLEGCHGDGVTVVAKMNFFGVLWKHPSISHRSIFRLVYWYWRWRWRWVVQWWQCRQLCRVVSPQCSDRLRLCGMSKEEVSKVDVHFRRGWHIFIVYHIGSRRRRRHGFLFRQFLPAACLLASCFLVSIGSTCT